MARSAAVALCLASPAGGPPELPVTLRSAWRSLSFGELTGIDESLRDIVRAPLAGVADGEALAATAAAYLRAGTMVGAAEELYCHRNTVLNRIRRFEELTDVDRRVPSDLALVTLALLPGLHDPSLRM